MFLTSRCTRCQRTLRVLARHEGKTLQCPGCAAAFVVSAAPIGVSPLVEPRRLECPRPAAEPARPEEPRADAAGQLVLPWLLLAPAALALALRLWVGQGILWPTLGVVLGGLCLLIGQRVHWSMARRVGVSLSLAILGHSLTLASPLQSAPKKEPPGKQAPLALASLPSQPTHPSPRQTPVLTSFSPQGEALMRSRIREGASPTIYRDLQPITRLGELLAMSFCPRPNGGAILVTTADAHLKEFSYPDFRLRARYRLEAPGYRAVVDGRRGTLWVAACAPGSLRVNQHGDPPRGRADLHVYDVPLPTENQSAATHALHPRRVLPLASDVLELLIAPDADALFYLAQDDNGVRVGRIDAERHMVEREVSLAETIRALCLTADGKTLYAAGNSSVLVLDPATLQLRRSVEVKVDVRTLTAANDSCVYLGEQGQWTRLTCLDLSAEEPALHQWPARLHGRIYLKLAADQHRLYVGSSSVITEQIDSLLVRGHAWKTPLVLAIAVSGTEGIVRGEFFLTPDGRYLVNRWGTVFRLAQL